MVNTFDKVFHLLSSAQRKQTLRLLILMIAGMAFEMLGIGLIIPVIGLLMDESYISKLSEIGFLASYIDFNNHTKVICYAMLGLLVAYICKTLYLGYLVWRQAAFTSSIQVTLSQRLLEIYMRQPYPFHLRRNSAELMRNVIGEVNLLSGAISHLLQIVAEGLVFVGICVLLFIVEPKGVTVTVAVLGGIGWILQKLTKAYSMHLGKTRLLHDGLRTQFLQEGIAGIKDIKVLGKERYFLNKHEMHIKISAHAGELQSLFQQAPRLLLEVLAVFGLVLFVGSMLMQGNALPTIVPTLGLFAAATFRLVPSASRIVSSFHTLRFSMPVIDIISRELELEKMVESSQEAHSAPLFHKGLTLDQVMFKYEEAACYALNSVSIEIPKGQVVGIIGQSGSGKSTLVDIILGLLRPESGRVLSDGNDVFTNLREWQAGIGYVPQTIFLTDDTLRRNIAFGVADDLIDEEKLNASVRNAQLEEYVSSLPRGLETMVGERGVRLSGGQRQRIGIARALYRDPCLLILDEATSALDTETESEIMQAIHAMRGNRTILIIAHRLTTVEQCNMIYRIEHGVLVESGTPKQLLRRLTTPY